ncbi:hypothetical protein BH20ACT13_BH20ACT13_14770 [soil metagenome]
MLHPLLGDGHRILLTSGLCLAVAVLPSAAGAAIGDLDSSFGTGGRVTTHFGASDSANAIALQANGMLIVAGDTRVPQPGDFALARYAPDGSLDTTFDGDGKVTTDFGGSDSVSALVVQPDGKIVAAGGTAGANPADIAIARYNPDGSLDMTFDGDGKVTTDFGLGLIESAADVAIQTDGKLVVAGVHGEGLQSDFALARYNPDGSLDASFGTGGKVVTSFNAGHDSASALVVQRDGRIVAAGSSGDFALARYNADGTVDSTFDGDGKVVIDFGGTDFARDLALQADGKLVVAGSTDPPDTNGIVEPDFALARLNVDGSLDTQGLDPHMDAPFGTGGKVTTDFGGARDEMTALAIEPGGNIVAAGSSLNGADGDFALARYYVSGSLDPSFGSAGKLTTSFTAGNDPARDVAIQRDGRIVAAGTAAVSSAAADFALARYVVGPCCAVEGSPPGGGPVSHGGSGKSPARPGGMRR